MYNLQDTIAAICTPPGIGGIAAIRISGHDSWEIAERIFSSQVSGPRSQVCFSHMHALHGFIRDNEEIIDEVMLLPYKGPNSYTTEDTIEIFCHGGRQIPLMILDLCLKNGARQASGGEFTFRAFVNGRIDLTEAEAINEIIHAETDKLVFDASSTLTGSLKEKVNNFRETLLSLVAFIEGSIEFPQDVPDINSEKIVSKLREINLELAELIKRSKEGQILRDGLKVSIVGIPNVGKSSLLNQLLENERAIVTHEPGTTRDTIEEKIVIDGYPVVLIDTAGIRKKESLRESERLGIERSQAVLEKSDITLLVFDLTIGRDKGTEEIFNLIDGKPGIIVGNKVDLIQADLSVFPDSGSCDVLVSAKYGTNIDRLKRLIIEKIKSLLPNLQYTTSPVYYINQRQKELLLQCSSSVSFAIDCALKYLPLDLIADELKKAVGKLEEVTGKRINEEIIENIFSKFCIGK